MPSTKFLLVAGAAVVLYLYLKPKGPNAEPASNKTSSGAPASGVPGSGDLFSSILGTVNNIFSTVGKFAQPAPSTT